MAAAAGEVFDLPVNHTGNGIHTINTKSTKHAKKCTKAFIQARAYIL